VPDIMVLLDAGADILLADNAGMSLLEFGVKRQLDNVLYLLICYGIASWLFSVFRSQPASQEASQRRLVKVESSVSSSRPHCSVYRFTTITHR
jgi:C4-dicarboxylate transporter